MNLSVTHAHRTYFPDPPGGMQEAIRQLCRATKGDGGDYALPCSRSPRPAAIGRQEIVFI